MKQRRYIRIAWVALLALLLLGLVATPVGATSTSTRQAQYAQLTTPGSTSVNATIYLATATLQPIFQSRISQQVPEAFNAAIASMVSKLPKQDQGWAQQMASTLIQPSVALTGLSPQAGGLATSIRISLYPGDPKPINASMLVSFKVSNSSTVQVSVQPMQGSPALINGPIATFQIPIGRLNSIKTTPTCGDAALAVNLQFPVSMNQAQARAANRSALSAPLQAQTSTRYHAPTGGVASYIELPASSLAEMGSTVGTIVIDSRNNLTARNIRIGVRGSNIALVSDIYWGNFRLGTATTLVVPRAAGGNLVVHVISTSVAIFGIFSFPYNSYNQQIQQTLNSKLNGALAGKFYVTQAAIGGNAHVPCAAGDSLVMTGNVNVG